MQLVVCESRWRRRWRRAARGVRDSASARMHLSRRSTDQSVRLQRDRLLHLRQSAIDPLSSELRPKHLKHDVLRA